MKRAFPHRLYLVLSEQSCVHQNFLEVARQAISGGVDIIQLREKNLADAVFIEKALRLQDVLTRNNIPLIINDALEVAQKVNAYGIHVGNNDVPPSRIRSVWKECKSIGYSIEFLEQLQSEEAQLSDCLGISPVFKTPTKTDTIAEWGLEGIRQIRTLSDKPLIAIGSMSALTAYDAIQAGADCIAVASAICGSRSPIKAAFEIRNQIEKAL